MITIKQSRHRFSSFFRNYDAVFKSKTVSTSTWQSAMIIKRILVRRGQLCPFFVLLLLLRSKMSFCPLRNSGVQIYACRLLVIIPATFPAEPADSVFKSIGVFCLDFLPCFHPFFSPVHYNLAF